MNDATADSTAGRRAHYAKHLPAEGDNARVTVATSDRRVIGAGYARQLLRAIAAALNDQRVPTLSGRGQWQAVRVQRTLARLEAAA